MSKKEKDEIVLGAEDYKVIKRPELITDDSEDIVNEYDKACEDTIQFIKKEHEKRPVTIPFTKEDEIQQLKYKQKENTSFYAQNPPKKISKYPWIRAWRSLTDKQQIITLMSVLTLIFVVFAAVIVLTPAKENSNDIVLKNYKKVFELGEEVKIKPSTFVNKKKTSDDIKKSLTIYSPLFTNTAKYVYDTDTGIVKSKDKDYLGLGNYSITLAYNVNGEKKEKDVDIKVKDTKAPEFKNFKSVIYVLQNSPKTYLSKYFKAEDLSGHVKISCDSDMVDLQTVGKYQMQVVAKDSSGNKKKESCTVNVISVSDLKSGKMLTDYADGTSPSGIDDVINEYRQNKVNEAKSKVDDALDKYNSAHQYTYECELKVNSLKDQISQGQSQLNSLLQGVSYYEQELQNAKDNDEGDDSIKYWEGQLKEAKDEYASASSSLNIESLKKQLSTANSELAKAQDAEQKAEDNYNKLYSDYQAQLNS